MYIAAFAVEIIGDLGQVIRADRDDTYDLSVLQRPGFRFELNEDVQGVRLLQVKVKKQGVRKCGWTFESLDVLADFQEDLRWREGKIKQAKFQFILNVDGKIKKVAFEITTPDATDLHKKKYSQIIHQHLETIGIKKHAQIPAERVVANAGAVV